MTAGLAARRGCGLRGDSGARAGGGDCGARRPPPLRAELARALSDERRTLSDGCPTLMGLRAAEALAPGGAAPRGPARRSLAATKLLEGCGWCCWCCCGLALAAVAAVGEGGRGAAWAGSATEPLSELPVGECGVAARPAHTAGTAPVCSWMKRCAAVARQANVA